MDLSHYREGRFTLSALSPDENRAIRYALLLWGGRSDLPITAATRELVMAATLIQPITKALKGLDGASVETLSDVLRDYHDHAKRYVGRVAGRLNDLDMPTMVDINSEVSQVFQTGRCAGQLAVDLAVEYDRLTNPVSDCIPADWTE